MSRGSQPLVTCDNCGRSIPRSKAVEYDKVVSFGTDLHTSDDVRFMTRRKVYYCISCAKHSKIFEKKRQAAERARRF